MSVSIVVVTKKKTRSKNAISAIEEVGMPSALNLRFLAIWLVYFIVIFCRLVLVNDQLFLLIVLPYQGQVYQF